MTHEEVCRERVAIYATDLAERIRAGKLNASAFEGLIWSYIDQPSFSGINKRELMTLAKRYV